MGLLVDVRFRGAFLGGSSMSSSLSSSTGSTFFEALLRAMYKPVRMSHTRRESGNACLRVGFLGVEAALSPLPC